jgi:hypothetical protein
MSTGLIEIIKVAAIEAIENSKPCDLRFGTVVSVSPLKIQISSNLTLPESVLIVPRHLTDYSVKCNIGSASNLDVNVVENTLVIANSDSNEEAPEEVDERTITIYNSLVVGDKVAMVRNQGGKSYYILDRI